MFYELWNVRSGNIINTYDTEGEALTAVRQLLTLNGEQLARSLSLAFDDDHENTTLVAKGDALAQLANTHHAHRSTVRRSVVDPAVDAPPAIGTMPGDGSPGRRAV